MHYSVHACRRVVSFMSGKEKGGKFRRPGMLEDASTLPMGGLSKPVEYSAPHPKTGKMVTATGSDNAEAYQNWRKKVGL